MRSVVGEPRGGRSLGEGGPPSLRLKSHCSCELFSPPLICSRSYKAKKGNTVGVRTRGVCVYCTQGQRPWERPIQARSRRARLPPRQLELISGGGGKKSRSALKLPFFLFSFVSFLAGLVEL